MDWKIIAGIVVFSLALLGGIGYAEYKISFAAGVASNTAVCNDKLTTQQQQYEKSQSDAVTLAAQAQAQNDAAQLSEMRRQLSISQEQALTAQRAADDAKAKASTLTTTLTRLKNENKDVDTWSNACLPTALLASLHPEVGGKAPSGACR